MFFLHISDDDDDVAADDDDVADDDGDDDDDDDDGWTLAVAPKNSTVYNYSAHDVVLVGQ